MKRKGELIAPNKAHQHLIRPVEPDEAGCDECGSALVPSTNCAICEGRDPAGDPLFCPACDFCCGC